MDRAQDQQITFKQANKYARQWDFLQASAAIVSDSVKNSGRGRQGFHKVANAEFWPWPNYWRHFSPSHRVMLRGGAFPIGQVHDTLFWVRAVLKLGSCYVGKMFKFLGGRGFFWFFFFSFTPMLLI